MLKSFLIVGLGGGLGSVLRYLVSVVTHKFYKGGFPLATFGINILGSLFIGILIGIYGKNPDINTSQKLLLVTGFCGGFTTFSAFSLENVSLIQNGQFSIALFYTLSSVFVGLLAVFLGLWIVKI